MLSGRRNQSIKFQDCVKSQFNILHICEDSNVEYKSDIRISKNVVYNNEKSELVTTNISEQKTIEMLYKGPQGSDKIFIVDNNADSSAKKINETNSNNTNKLLKTIEKSIPSENLHDRMIMLNKSIVTNEENNSGILKKNNIKKLAEKIENEKYKDSKLVMQDENIYEIKDKEVSESELNNNIDKEHEPEVKVVTEIENIEKNSIDKVKNGSSSEVDVNKEDTNVNKSNEEIFCNDTANSRTSGEEDGGKTTLNVEQFVDVKVNSIYIRKSDCNIKVLWGQVEDYNGYEIETNGDLNQVNDKMEYLLVPDSKVSTYKIRIRVKELSGLYGAWSEYINIINNNMCLQEDTVLVGDTYIFNTTVNLNGHALSVQGNVEQLNSTMEMQKGKLLINGNYLLNGASLLYMTNEEDYVLVLGDFITCSSADHENKLKAGTLEVKGNFAHKEGNMRGFYATGTHRVVLSGNSKQIVELSNRGCSQFGIIDMSLAYGIEFIGTIVAKTNIIGMYNLYNDSIKISNSTLDLTDDELLMCDVELSSCKVNLHGYQLGILGGIILNNSTVDINAGEFSIYKDVNQNNTELKVNKGKIEIYNDYNISGYSSFSMQHKDDYIKVYGNMNVESTKSSMGYIENGIVELKGNLTQRGTSLDNFYARGENKVLFTGEYVQIIDFENTYGCQLNILDYKDAIGVIVKGAVCTVQKIGKLVYIDVDKIIDGIPLEVGVNELINKFNIVGVDLRSRLQGMINDLVMELGIEYMTVMPDNLGKFVMGTIVGIDDNVFLGTLCWVGGIDDKIEEQNMEADYSFMLGKTVIDQMFVTIFEKIANESEAAFESRMTKSLVLIGGGVIVTGASSGAGVVVGEAMVESGVRELTKAVVNLAIALVATAGEIHSRNLLYEDRAKLKNTVMDYNGIKKTTEGAAQATGTIWDSIKATQPLYEGTQIPKSFEMTVGNQKIWVHGNATEHIYEDVAKVMKTPGINPNLYSQELLSDFQGALQEATKNGIKYNELMNVGKWEFKFSAPRQEGQLPALIHSQFNGWGK